ncbi:peptidase A4 family-domain-containing protein [Mycena maculata]|uniref:Peptidase A4 family-domain-containing protein n=1 Tax=Mycena maculata TaxID=230809 RepID=A0AAD7KGZ1_9AGAR|nr:peptidase A4 family-domain-containing protein [Mycena maculata]
MVFTATLLSYVLFATAAFAAPRGRGISDRVSRRAGARRSGLMRPSTDVEDLAANANISHVSYSTNWGGAAWESPAGTYTSVKGTFIVPTPSAPSGKTGSHAASAWVGIDGDTCSTAILQTGVDFTIDDGEVSFDAWYEYYPAVSFDFDLKVSAGDTITLTATSTGTKSGTVTISNETTGKSVSKDLTSTAKLCGENAEWIVEDFEEGDSLVPFADFGTVKFTDAVATTSTGSTVGPEGAALIDIKQSSTVLTSVTATDSTLTVKYA